ncbi:MAG: LuxR C-terminal-related transcriptional regulator [Phycisphaerales bacterium JB063]
MAKITILLADDHEMLMDSLADRLDKEPDLRVVGRVTDASLAVEAANRLEPTVVLLDIDMPGKVSFDAAREIIASHPDTRVIFLSAFFSDRYIEDALRSGCSGYVTKDESADRVVDAVRQAANDGAYYSPKVRDRLVVDPEKGLTHEDAGPTKSSTLTPREVEILRYIAQGMTKKEVAQQIHRSVSTVDKHVENVMRKLNIHDRVELARYAIREGLSEA